MLTARFLRGGRGRRRDGGLSASLARSRSGCGTAGFGMVVILFNWDASASFTRISDDASVYIGSKVLTRKSAMD